MWTKCSKNEDPKEIEHIIWLDQTPRLNHQLEALNRAGYIQNKTHPINRVFDHLAFIYRFGESVHTKLEFNKRVHFVNRPHCSLMLPGETWISTPLEPYNELYFVFPQTSVDQLFEKKQPIRSDFSIFYLEENSLIPQYVNLFIELLEQPLNPGNCTQLDLLALAMLSATYWHDVNEKEDRLTKIETYINKHYSETFDLNELANKYGMSYATFRRLWSEKHKSPPWATILSLRNRKAKEFLANRNLSISKVAELCGFDDVRYFSRFFRHNNEMSPKEYRHRA
jgi:AraC-like DNA-binding protein